MALAEINMEYFDCQQTGDGRWVLDTDPTLQCWTGWHSYLWPVAAFGGAPQPRPSDWSTLLYN